MKKIKGLFLFGILALFGIGSSFAITGVNSTFSYIDGNNHTYTNLNGMNPRIMYNYIGYDWYSSGSNFVLIKSFNASTYTGFYRSFYSSNGTKLNYYSDDYIFFNLGTINQSLLFIQESDYLNYDGFPLVYDSFGNYLTFSGNNQIVYNGNFFDISNVNNLQYCFYGTNFNLSCLFSDPNNDPGYKFKSFNVDNNSVTQYNNIAIIPLHEIVSDTGAGYFSGSITLVLSYGNYNSMQNLGIIYNLYNCYSSDPDILQNCNINSKGYININSDTFFHRNFLSLLSPVSTNHSLILGSFAQIFYQGGHFYFRNNSSLYNYGYGAQSTSISNISKNCLHYNNCYMQGELDLVVDNSVEDLISVSTPISTGNSVSSSSLYYNCLGPTFQTPDGLPPVYCYDSSGSLDLNRFKNCYDVIEDLPDDSGFISHTYCYNDGFQQEVVLVPDGSGYSLVPGVNNTNVLDFINNSTGYLIGYFDEYLNNTGFFFKCPWPYDNKLVVWPKIISLLNGTDIALPINCTLAGFSYGKNAFTFENSGHFVPDGPLLNFEGDNRNLLYLFFDILISFGIIFFIGKLFYLFHK